MDQQRPITLVLADDHGIVREGIAAFCGSHPELTVIAQCADGVETVETVLRLQPDFLVLDPNMQSMSGLEVIRRLRQANSTTRILVLSVSREETLIRELFQSGANGYLLKEGPARHLFDAIHYVLDGGQYLTPLIQRETIERAREKQDPLSSLSRREHEVFSRLVDGMRPKDIAKLLEISPKTVDTYRANIMRKLDVDGIAGLVRFAIQRNLPAGSPVAAKP